MQQELFDSQTKQTRAVYRPFPGTAPHYELAAIAVIWGDCNNRIRVLVLDENGDPAFNVTVRHSFGSEFEHFAFVGEAIQFNLGGGSHFSVPNEPPNRITIEGAMSDEVLVGNANTIGFAHTEWQMTFKKVNQLTPLPPPDANPPPPGSVTEQRVLELITQAFARARIVI